MRSPEWLLFLVLGLPIWAGAAPFNSPLQQNGGFEDEFAHWTIISGNSVVMTQNTAKGKPHGGLRFWHGGLRAASDSSTVRQDIDLLAAGFLAAELDAQPRLQAEVWLRNYFGSGTFDDQVFMRVTYIDGAEQPISALRCIIPANSVWIRTLLSGAVPPGTRRLWVEMVGRHRRDADNDSMADDLIVRLLPGAAIVTPQITKLPMLQDYRQDAMTLLWETDGNQCTHSVDWGRESVQENVMSQVETLQIDARHFVHRAEIRGLSAETRYVYRVRSGDRTTTNWWFTTAPHRDTAFAVGWWGDNHEGVATVRSHLKNLMAHSPNLICVAGDMVNSGNDLSEWHNYWFKPLEYLNASQTTPVLFARGNHDGEHALSYAYSVLPGNGAWFGFDYGNSRLLFLDSEVDSSGSPEQLEWLRRELESPESRRAAFRIVCFHKPPWTDFWNGGGYVGETWLRNDWTPLFAKGQVDLVICGHTHAYCRGNTNGVYYVVSGGGGGAVDTERVARWPMFTHEFTDTHFDLMEVDGGWLDWRMFNSRNQLMDQFRLHSHQPELRCDSEPLQLVLIGRAGQEYVIEMSADLQSWASYRTLTVPFVQTSSIVQEIESAPTRGFFRARVSMR